MAEEERCFIIPDVVRDDILFTDQASG